MLPLGHTFKDEALLAQALTHPSASKRKDAARAYERLEFLGDRVLGLVMAEWLFELFPNEAEGELARRHAALVKRDTLAKVAEKIGLPAALRHAKGEVANATMLGDALEALIGALYCDGGLKAAHRFIHTHFTALVEAKDADKRDAKTALQEWAQARKLPTPTYTVIANSGPAHAPSFVVEVTVKNKTAQGEGKNKQLAEKAAAQTLLKILETK